MSLLLKLLIATALIGGFIALRLFAERGIKRVRDGCEQSGCRRHARNAPDIAAAAPCELSSAASIRSTEDNVTNGSAYHAP